MRSMPHFARARWTAVAITATDPIEFASEYEKKMNQLTSEGWNITGMMERGGGVVITAQKQEMPEEVMKAFRALVTERTARPVEADVDTIEEVTYAYQEGSSCKSIRCGSLSEAVAYLEEHAREDGAILPISIVTLTTKMYEPADLPLLKELCK